MRMFDALFKVVRTLFGPLTIERYIEHPHFIYCYSFQNLRLGTQWGLIWEHKLRNCLVYTMELTTTQQISNHNR